MRTENTGYPQSGHCKPTGDRARSQSAARISRTMCNMLCRTAASERCSSSMMRNARMRVLP